MYNKKDTFNPRYRWFILAMGVLAQITFATAFAGIPVAGVLMRESYHFSIIELGFVLGCMGLGVTFSEIFWGILTDKLGDKIVLIIGLVSMGGTFLVIAGSFVPENGVAPHYLSLGFLLVMAGALGGSINSSSGRTVMSWFQDSERGFAMSIRQTAIPIGGAFGSILVPWIASSYGFRYVFLALAFLCLVTAICVWRWVMKANNQHTAAEVTHLEVISPLKRFSVWKIALAGAMLTIPQMAILTFAAVFLHDNQNLDMVTISITLVLIQLGGAGMRIITGRYTDKNKNRREVIRFIAIIAGLANIALGLFSVQSHYLVLVLLMVSGVASHAWQGIAYTEIAVMSGMQRSGTALGMIGTAVFAMAFLTPYTIPYILSLASWNVVWIITGLLSLVALPLVTRSVALPITSDELGESNA